MWPNINRKIHLIIFSMRIDFGYTLQKGKEEKGVAEESLLF